MNSRYTWVNGEMVASSDAMIPLLTSGLHYGIGIFEGIRAYDTADGPAVFRLRDHMTRFEQSAKILGFRELPYSIDEMTAAILDTVKANGFGDCYIRPLIHLADGGWNLTLDTGKPFVSVAVWQQSVYLGQESPDSGLRAVVSSFTRHHPGANMTKAKISGNYVNSVLAKTDAQRQGVDEAILLDPEGYVAECTGANVFLVRGKRLITPSPEAILEGITRSTIFSLAEDLHLDAVEARVSRDHLYIADEVFVCGTAAEIVGVAEIDRRQVGAGATGPITKKLKAAYADAVRGKHPRSNVWLEYVNKRALTNA